MKRGLIMMRRIVRTGILNFIRNAWLGIAAMAVMVITLTIILFSVIANATFANTIQTITDRIDISVYIKDEVTSKQLDGLITQVRGLENVRDVNFVTKDEALKVYRQQNANNPELLQAISQTENPLPASLQIRPKDPNRIESIRTFLEKPEIKALQSDETSYSGDRKAAIDKITSATNFFQRAGIAGVIVFAVISMLIIFNTIQMAIFNRRDELTIMRLLGASTNFIRGPFIVESIMYGVVSGLVSITIVRSLFSISAKTFEASSLGLLDIQFSNQYFSRHFWLFLLLQLLVGIFIGALSSLIATRRYLKFKTSK
ncbi:ABC transporter permease [Candidatus Saccharibacteria bacterium]|nr:MAG: ABC transporter permease [Candidatus Saccharibacteria bacterium]